MIKVTVYEKDNRIHTFELSGHAESGPYGYDLVCAGVSAVSFGAINAVIQLCEIEPTIKQGDEGGYLYVIIPDNLDTIVIEKVQLLLEGMIVSLETIEREYNQFINIRRQ